MNFSVIKYQQQLLAWYDSHGRKDLPWQKNKTPYRVWLSEVMLQQTQVKTVIPYFKKFIKNFPTIKALAKANLDEVLTDWAGLGFYARARNLHRTARIVSEEFQGKFPEDLKTLQTLPGIGRSTAGAIVSLALNQKAAILDGNVKRVLIRLFAIEGFPNDSQTLKELWNLAEKLSSPERPADYTQAIMDLGATVCAQEPHCGICPLQKICRAKKQGIPASYPAVKVSKSLPERSVQLLLLFNDKGEILLEKRPPVGIWGGLWSLPEATTETDVILWAKNAYDCSIEETKLWPTFRHTFSHFHLFITPVLAKVNKWSPPLMESPNKVWYKIAQLKQAGLPAPVKTILQQFTEQFYDSHDPLPKAKKRSRRT